MNSTETSPDHILNSVIPIFSIYITPTISAIALITNFISYLLLKNQKSKIYKLLKFKSIIDICLSLIGIDFSKIKCYTCNSENVSGNLDYMIYSIYLLSYSYVVLIAISETVDFTLVLNRYRVLINRTISAKKLALMNNVLILITFGIYLPDLFAFSLKLVRFKCL